MSLGQAGSPIMLWPIPFESLDLSNMAPFKYGSFTIAKMEVNLWFILNSFELLSTVNLSYLVLLTLRVKIEAIKDDFWRF